MLRARQRLGKYRIERRITNGPLAAVYQAFDTIHGIRVALKVPHTSAMDEAFLVDFKREARLAPKLEHPNILPIRDASFIEGRFVIAMPLGDESLGDRMRRRIATGTALHFADQALAAVAHAHHNKVIHCDLKPDNFVIFPDDQLKLGDFAFSKVAQRTIKASGSGTIGYMAPEQAVGRPMFQSDVFALGLVIYELFSGHLHDWPYDWPPKYVDRVKRKLNPSLLEWLRKATQVRPADRYKDAVSMYREFRRLRNGSAKKQTSVRRRASDDPSLWKSIRFRQFQRKYRKNDLTLDQKTLDALLQLHWPGNIRELAHTLEHMVLTSAGTTLPPPPARSGDSENPGRVSPASGFDFTGGSCTLEAVERNLILEALQHTGGNVSEVARILGLTRGALRHRMDKRGIKP